ncbi:MAG: metallophosphoesterase [Terriglobales bacterium]
MIGILHLSDIHLLRGANPALERVDHIKGALQSEGHDVTDLLLVVSGDVAFSGKQAEYSHGMDMIAELEESLRSVKGIAFLGTVVVPGNHDCDFDNEGSVRPVLLSTINEFINTVEASSDVVEQILKVQEKFFEFEELTWKPHPLGSRLFWTREFESSSGQILIHCFNTAWLSRKKELPAQLFFPIQIVPDISSSDSDAVLVLSVFHHPYGWLQPENARSFRRLIETSSDIVLTGHEHDGEAYARTSGSGANVNYVEGAALQAPGVDTGFNFVKADLAAQTYQVRAFKWEQKIYVPQDIAAGMFARNQALLEHQFLNNKDFKEYLDEIGTPFSHPFKTRLSLSDLFVYPDLKVTSMPGQSGGEVVVMSNDVVDYVVRKRRVSIAGAQTSGKTSVAKSLYNDLLQRKKLVPVLLQGSDIRGTSPSQVLPAVQRAFEQQYSKKLLDRFNQLDPESKVVIIDDWHKARLNANGRSLVIKSLDKLFGRLIVLTDEASSLYQMTDAVATGELPDLTSCEIKQFGYRLRGELVGKWETLGREFEVEELELTHRISEGEHLLDSLIGKGIVPAFPFFIFSVLQADTTSSHNASFGSYGHIYHALLTARMARVNPKTLSMNFVYLSFVAFQIFETGRNAISRSDLRALHERYEKEFMRSVDQTALLKELEESQVLSASKEEVRFKYKYAYYYFLAQYFKDGIDNVRDAEPLRERLGRIADNAYEDDNAHTLIFYLYMSKDRMVIEHILHNAQKLFADGGTSDLNSDVQFANALYGTPPKLEAPPEDTDRNREEYRARRDEAADSEDTLSSPHKSDNLEDRDLEFSSQSMNIMGQVLRNFPADLRADLKMKLTRESYNLGLRTLHTFLKFLEANTETFRRDMFAYFKPLQPFAQKTDKEVHVSWLSLKWRSDVLR